MAPDVPQPPALPLHEPESAGGKNLAPVRRVHKDHPHATGPPIDRLDEITQGGVQGLAAEGIEQIREGDVVRNPEPSCVADDDLDVLAAVLMPVRRHKRSGEVGQRGDASTPITRRSGHRAA